jgi:hypothetical protein
LFFNGSRVLTVKECNSARIAFVTRKGRNSRDENQVNSSGKIGLSENGKAKRSMRAVRRPNVKAKKPGKQDSEEYVHPLVLTYFPNERRDALRAQK